jgi:hypothetical protein
MVVKDHRREHVAVLGDRERRHLQHHRFVEELVNAARAVQQRELGVQMEMNELGAHRDTSRRPRPVIAEPIPIQ